MNALDNKIQALFNMVGALAMTVDYPTIRGRALLIKKMAQEIARDARRHELEGTSVLRPIPKPDRSQRS